MQIIQLIQASNDQGMPRLDSPCLNTSFLQRANQPRLTKCWILYMHYTGNIQFERLISESYFLKPLTLAHLFLHER
jgi:hypothetical protein